jgi:cell pole-organizing protein PopZ
MDEILASIRRILAEDEYNLVSSPRRVRTNGDVLDLTEALNDDGTVRHIAPIALVTPEVPPVLPDGRIEPVAPLPTDAANGQRLVSEAASDAIAASFARLASVPRHDELDELVCETLRPLLQAWLDKHLPDLVERLVRAEIARVVGANRPLAP